MSEPSYDHYLWVQGLDYCPTHEGSSLDGCKGPHCDECFTADVEADEWCDSCRCCAEHCQKFEDCPVSVPEAIANYLAAATAFLNR